MLNKNNGNFLLQNFTLLFTLPIGANDTRIGRIGQWREASDLAARRPVQFKSRRWWGREAPHELAGKRPQGAGAHVNEQTAAAAPAIHPPPPPPTSLIPPLCLLPLHGTPSYYCPQAQTETGAKHS